MGLNSGIIKKAFHLAPLTLLLVLLTNQTYAQLTQPFRYEKEQKNGLRDFTVISMEERGIALIRDKQKNEKGSNLWEVILLDSTLKETWTKDLAIENRYVLKGHDYRDTNVYLLFRLGESDQGKIKIIKIDGKTFETEEYNYEPELTIQLTHFVIVADQAILAGYVTNQPTLLLYNLEKKQAKLIPGLIVENSELLDVRVNVNNTFNLLLTERQSKTKKRLIIKTFDYFGALLLDDVIEVDQDKTILSGFTSTLIRDELMIIGTWGQGVTKEAYGVFTVLVDPYNEQKITYYDFAQCTHFLDYLSPKRSAKIKVKSENRRKLGKIPDYKVFVLPNRIVETKNGFLYYLETYYSSNSRFTDRNQPFNLYNNNPLSPYSFNSPYRMYNSPYGYGNPFYSSSTYSNDVKMLSGSLLVFDAKGEMVADHTIKFDELKIPFVEQISDFIYSSNRSSIVFNKEKEIYHQMTQTDGVALENQTLNMVLNSPMESIRTEDDIGTVRFWYGKFLYIYGYQTVKNPEKPNREVFYINKLKIE